GPEGRRLRQRGRPRDQRSGQGLRARLLSPPAVDARRPGRRIRALARAPLHAQEGARVLDEPVGDVGGLPVREATRPVASDARLAEPLLLLLADQRGPIAGLVAHPLEQDPPHYRSRSSAICAVWFEATPQRRLCHSFW